MVGDVSSVIRKENTSVMEKIAKKRLAEGSYATSEYILMPGSDKRCSL